jgi:opacity protein-like surface antigen
LSRQLADFTFYLMLHLSKYLEYYYYILLLKQKNSWCRQIYLWLKLFMMKTLNLLLMILLFSLTSASVSAQFTKGSTWLGGSAGYASSTSESQYTDRTKTRTFNINPAIGKVIKPGTVAGIELGYNFHKEERNNFPYQAKSKAYSIGVFTRKYIEPFKKFYLFGHAGLGASFARYNSTSSFPANPETKSWQTGVSLYPGVSYALTSKIFLEAVFINLFTISYSASRTVVPGDIYHNNSFSANVNLNNAANFGIGIRFILPGAKKTN